MPSKVERPLGPDLAVGAGREWRPRAGCSNAWPPAAEPDQEDAVSEPTIRELAEAPLAGRRGPRARAPPGRPGGQPGHRGDPRRSSLPEERRLGDGDRQRRRAGVPGHRRPLRRQRRLRRGRGAGAPTTPLAVAVFSHHHIDHVFGTARFEAEAARAGLAARPAVYGHELMASHFDRYERTRGWNAAINKRQFGLPIDTFTWPAEFRRPDVTYARHAQPAPGATSPSSCTTAGARPTTPPGPGSPSAGSCTRATSSSTACPTPGTPRRSSAT